MERSLAPGPVGVPGSPHSEAAQSWGPLSGPAGVLQVSLFVLCFSFFDFVAALFGYHSHAIRFTHLKFSGFHCFSVVHSSSLPGSRIFSAPQKEALNAVAVTPCSHSLILGSHESTSPLHGFACSGYFIEMESHDMWSFVTGFFHSVVSRASVCHSCLWTNNIPLFV